MARREEKSSSNWAAAAWFTGRKGFLLTDALVSVFIVSILAALTSAALISHYHAMEAIHEQIEEQSEKDARILKEIERCDVCSGGESASPETSAVPY